ncbi:hypothetical protein [Microvirga lotononidis]|uniref:Uncharacterized protein n=1 Tax=Microvirga lotononidis TaxID=864069 RepID=I4YS90_9HYPH|nr:hypothetical protein [Microvirga lotononidis]EIM26832.1 hypothetical protein MicloDRAFT_00033830 [Microvirga lotononidis]WQO31389.1 hypothetical protein U0023_34465 [Microvirga lotononidis]
MDRNKIGKVVLAYKQGGSGLFTRDQVTKLQSMLGLDDYETASEIASFITSVLGSVDYHIEARKKIPRDGDEQERLRDIAKLARKLHRLLAKEPALQSLLSRPKGPRGGRGLTLDEIAEIGRRPKELLLNLEILAEQSTRQAKDDAEFARVRTLLPNVTTKDPEGQIATRMLWPHLFDIWTDIGKRKLAKTPNGPVHRFIALVHEVGDLPEPKASTIGNAIDRRNGVAPKPRKARPRRGGR